MLTLALGMNALAAEDFPVRLAEYQKLHEKAASQIARLRPTPRPEDIEKHERDLAHRIRAARPQTMQGNIFTPDNTAQFKRLIGETMRGEEAVTIRQSLSRSEPVKLDQLRVNQAYPKGVPLQTTPPSLLANLLRLPKGFEYRVVGSNLVLLDVEANLIVDFIPNAIP